MGGAEAPPSPAFDGLSSSCCCASWFLLSGMGTAATATAVPPVVVARPAPRPADAPAADFFDLLSGDEFTAQSWLRPLKKR
jgi:hypothetical protein